MSDEHAAGDIVPVEHPAMVSPPIQSTPQLALPVTPFDKIAEAVSGVMSEIGTVSKEGKNPHFNYKYTRYEDLLQALTPLLGKHGLALIPSEVDRGYMDDGRAVFGTYEFVLIHKSGQCWPERMRQTGVSLARSSKGTFDDKSLNKCRTQAHKECLRILFNIPSRDDSERDVSGRPPKAAPIGPITPHDSVTGEVIDATQPRMLPKDAQQSWQEWGRVFLRAILHCTRPDLVGEWRKANLDNLEQFRKAFPDMHAMALQTINKKMRELTSTKEPQA